MMIQDASQLPWKTYQAQLNPTHRHKLALAALTAGALFFAASQAALADATSWISAKRQDHPLALALWSPPPEDTRWIVNEAQMGLPDAPFVFSGDTLYAGASFGSNGQILIDKQATIHVDHDVDLGLNGTVSNQGSSTQGLIKRGAGTLTLAGNNNYRGNTLLQQGTLHVAGTSALGQSYRTLDMYEGTTLSYAPGAIVYNAMQLRPDIDGYNQYGPSGQVRWRVDEGSATQAGIVNGPVHIVKLGLGTLHLVGFATNPASATIDQGALNIDDFFGGSILVNAGARLEGRGTMGSARVRNGATLAPGTGLGMARLSVTGDLVFEAGSLLQLDVNAAGQSDSINVMGHALLNGQVQVRAQSGDWQAETRYTVLRADQGLLGTRFASAVTNLHFLQPTLSYDDKHAYLSLHRNATPLDDPAETPTEDDVANTVDQDDPGVRDDILAMDKEQAREAFRQLSGSWHASVLSGLAEDSRHIRMATLQNALPSTQHFWQQAFHATADRASYQGIPDDNRALSGIAAGLTHPLGDRWHAGLLAGAQQSQARRSHAMASTRIDSLHAGLSLAGRLSAADVAIGVVHSWHAVQSARKIAVAGLRDALSGNTRGHTLQLFSEWTAPLRWLGATARRLPATTQIAPFVRYAWVQTQLRGHTESGGAAALKLEPARHTLHLATLGLKADHTVETAQGQTRLHGELAWRHAGGDAKTHSRQRFRDSPQQRAFTSEGQPIARQAWSLRLGFDAQAAKRMNLGFAYAGQYARRQQEHGLHVNARWVF